MIRAPHLYCLRGRPTTEPPVAESAVREYYVVPYHNGNRRMTGASLKNQQRIIANQKAILRNQSKILRDLQATLRNQKRILANQSRILTRK